MLLGLNFIIMESNFPSNRKNPEYYAYFVISKGLITKINKCFPNNELFMNSCLPVNNFLQVVRGAASNSGWPVMCPCWGYRRLITSRGIIRSGSR